MKPLSRLLPALAVLLAASPAVQAHTGHGPHGVLDGLAHPLGLDHLLAMLAVGLWSVVALPPGRRVVGPAVFMAALLTGAVAGAAGMAMPLVETAIAASVVVLALMLAVPGRIGVAPGLALVAAAGALHGLAHGAELPVGGSFAGYAAGFLVTTAVLHAVGLLAAVPLLAWHRIAWRLMSAGVGLTGLLLMLRA